MFLASWVEWRVDQGTSGQFEWNVGVSVEMSARTKREPQPRTGSGAHDMLMSGRDIGESELLLHDREDVAHGEDQVVLVVVLHLGTAVLAVDDDVTNADVEWDSLVPILVKAARAHG